MVKNLPSVERSTKIRFGKHVPDSNDQEENTIVFNASNVAFPTPYSNAVYLSPVRYRTDYAEPQVVLLMYDRATKEITESGEAANTLVGAATLATATNRGNVTSNTAQFIDSLNNVGFVTNSNVGISNLLPQHTLSVGSNLYIDDLGSEVLVVSGNVSILKDMTVEGNLTVNGDTTLIYTENTSIKDAFIELGQDNTLLNDTIDLGILMHRPEPHSNVVIGYRDNGRHEFAIAFTDSKPTDQIFVPKSDEDINVHVYGLTHIDANIYAHKDLLVTGNVHVSTNASVSEELSVSGNVYADKDLEILGNTYVSGNVVASKDLLVTGNVYVSTNVSVSEELTVSGNVYADKDLEILGNTYVSGNVVASKDLLVTGNVYVSTNVSVSEELTVSGNVTASKDLLVTGNVYVSTNASVTEELTVSGNVYADKDLEILGNAYVSGNVIASKDLLVTGNVYVSTNVSVTEELTVTGNVYADKDLELTGNAYVSGNVIASKDLLVTGNVYVFTNASVSEELTVSGNVVASKDLLVTGNVYVSTNVSVTEELTVTGNVYADKDLEILGNTYVSGNVNVTKQLSVTGNTYVSGNVEVTKSLIVSANTHLKGDNVFITHTMDFLDPTTAIVTDQVSNVQIRLGQLENVSNLASNPRTNQVLRYINNEWSNDYPQQNFTRVKNGYSIAEGRTLYKGNTVYVSATQNAGLVQVRAAQSHVASQMPCIGIVYEDIGPEAEGVILTYGILNNLNTTHLTAGGTVYVSNVYSGYHTSVKPDDDVAASPDLIQNLGICTRSHASSGAIFVTGIGRANDIPNAELITDYNEMNYVYVNDTNNDLKKITSANLNIPLTTAVSSSSNSAANAVTLRGVSITSGGGFHGDLTVAGNVTVDTNTFKVDAEANRVGILTASPGQTLDVRGAANVGALTTTSTSVTDTTHSTSKDTGVLIVTNGGLGVEANIHSTNVFAASHIAVGTSATTKALDVRGTSNVGVFTTPDATVTDSTAATSTSTGALKVTGGAGIQGDLYANDGHFTADVSVGSLTNKYIPYANASKILTDSQISQEADGTVVISNDVEITGSLLVQGESFEVSSGQLVIQDRIIDIANNNPDHDLDIGILMEHPGHNIAIIHHPEDYLSLGYTQNGYSDTHIFRDYSNEFTVNVWGYVTTQNTITIVHNDLHVESGKIGVNTTDPTADIYVVGNVHVTSNISTASNVLITGDAAATSKTTGALQVTGGVGIQGDVYTTNITGSGTVKGSTLTGTNLYGTIAGSNTAAVSDLTASGTVKGATLTGTNLYGTISGANTASVSTLTATGTVKGTTLTGTNLYGTISGANTAAVSTLTASGTVKGATLTGTNLYGTISGANTAAVSTLTASGVVDITDTTVSDSITTGALKVAGGISTQANLYVGKDTYITSNLNVDGSTLHVDSKANRVGIGKTDPAYALDVSGDINFSGDLYKGASLFVSSPWTIETSPDALSYTDGNVGVGASDPEATLHITGNAYVSSNLQVGQVANLYVDTINSKVGIGKTDPAYALDVSGDINFSGDLYKGASLFVSSPWTIETGPDALSYTDGNVGVGASDPEATLHITGNTYVSSNLQVGQVANLYVDTINSKVGIGKTDPAYALDVSGDINFSGDLYKGASLFVSSPWTIETGPDALSYTDGNVGVGASNPDATLHITGNTYVSSNLQVGEVANLYVDTINSRVGIGKTNPGYTLDVSGDINFSGDLYKGASLFVSTPWTIETGPDALSYTDGNIGVGASNPEATLHITGNAYVSSNLQVGEVANLYVDTINSRVGIGTNTPSTDLHVHGGTIINSDQVSKKTYSYTGTITSGTAPSIAFVFSNHAFSAKITAQLIESDIEISNLTIDVTGGRRGGASVSTLDIAKGTLHIFGNATSNPWSSTVSTNATTVTITPSTNLDGTGYYNLFVEYISADSGGNLTKIQEGGFDEHTFGY